MRSGIGREAAVYLAGFVGSGSLQLLAIPVYSRALGPEQYGHFALFIAATTVLSGAMALGGDVALARFWADAETEGGRRQLASTWIAFLTLWSLLVASAACLLAPTLAHRLSPDSRLTVVLMIGFFGLVPAQFSRMLAQVLRNRFRPVSFAVTTVFGTALNVSLGIGLGVGLGYGVVGIAIGIVLGEAGASAVRMYLVRRDLELPRSWWLVRPLLRFGLPLVPASLANWVFTGLDRIVVGAFLSGEQLGFYGLSATLVGPFTILTLSLSQAWLPRISQINARSEGDARTTTALATEVAALVLGALAIALASFAPLLVAAVAGRSYLPGAEALPYLSAGSAFAGISLFTATGVYLSRKTGWIPVVTVLAALIDGVLLLTLTPRWGLAGAALAVALAFLALAIGNLVASRRVFRMTLPSWRVPATIVVVLVHASLATRYPGTPAVWCSGLLGAALLGAMGAGTRQQLRRTSRG